MLHDAISIDCAVRWVRFNSGSVNLGLAANHPPSSQREEIDAVFPISTFFRYIFAMRLSDACASEKKFLSRDKREILLFFLTQTRAPQSKLICENPIEDMFPIKFLSQEKENGAFLIKSSGGNWHASKIVDHIDSN